MNKASREQAFCGGFVNAKPWEEIAGFFRWIVEGGGAFAAPMLALVERIAASPHAERLFAITSMHTLVVSSSTPFLFGCEVLRIHYDHRLNEFHFNFIETGYAHRGWSKQCPPAEAFGAVEHVARMKGWIPRILSPTAPD